MQKIGPAATADIVLGLQGFPAAQGVELRGGEQDGVRLDRTNRPDRGGFERLRGFGAVGRHCAQAEQSESAAGKSFAALVSVKQRAVTHLEIAADAGRHDVLDAIKEDH